MCLPRPRMRGDAGSTVLARARAPGTWGPHRARGTPGRTESCQKVMYCLIPCVLLVIARSCPTVCGPIDCSLPGSSVHGILQARILKLIAISFSGDFPDLGTEPVSPALSCGFFTSESPRKPVAYMESLKGMTAVMESITLGGAVGSRAT